MNQNKLKILIVITIILTLIMVLIIRERQHLDKLIYYNEVEIQQEEARLKVSQELIRNYNELQRENDRLNELLKHNDIEWELYTVTAYTKNDDGVDNITSIGLDLNDNWMQYFNFAAVDPKVIPYGTIVFIKLDGKIISALAVDCGGLIKGKHIDFYCEPSELSKIGNGKLPLGVIK